MQAGREGGCFTQHHMSGKDKCKNIKSLWSWGQITQITRLGGLSPWLSEKAATRAGGRTEFG